MHPETWNGINVGVMIAGLLCVLIVPIYWIGMPLFVVAAFLPAFLFRTARSSRMKSSATVAYKVAGKSDLKKEDFEDADDEQIQMIPEGDATLRQKLQIEARQSPAYDVLRNLLGNGMVGRVDLMLLDYTRQAVNGRMQIDGVWNPMPPLDRDQGDAMLMALKNLAGMNPADRRTRQQGRFDLKWDQIKQKVRIDVTSQGVATGEQVHIKFSRTAVKPKTMLELGLQEDGVTRSVKLMNASGLVIVSAPPQGGLTTLWQSALLSSDRMTRDAVAIFTPDERDSAIENVQQNPIKPEVAPLEMLRKILLTQPNVLVIPDLIDRKLADAVVNEVLVESRTVLTRSAASSCAEALLNVYSQVGDRKKFAQAVTGIINQRLVRKLCRKCREEIPAKPELILKLGGNPRTQKTLFRHYQLPPVEKRVDERGNPVEMEPCSGCNGTGFYDRTAALEVVEVDSQIRKALLTTPQVEAIEKVIRTAGFRSLLDEASRLVLAGETSLDEVRRVFRPSGK
jgi:type II secretory ATPase GspE/PulE/Tfp pilus assembly ATPase PilB-like protein